MVGEEKENKASRKGGALPFWVRDFLSPDSIRPLLDEQEHLALSSSVLLSVHITMFELTEYAF